MRLSRVNLPHDWQIYHADELYRDGIAGIGGSFFLQKKTRENSMKFILMDVYMD